MKYRKIPILCAIVILLVFTAPILYVLFKSFSGNQYYELVINNYNYFKYALRTIGYSALSGFLSVVIALPVGYLFAKVRFRFRNIIFYIYILVMLLPFQATQLSGYLLFKKLNAIDDPITLIVTMSFSPLAVFLIRQCLTALPDDTLCYAYALDSFYANLLHHIQHSGAGVHIYAEECGGISFICCARQPDG